MTATATPTEPTTQRRSRAWIVYFVLLVMLGCFAMLAPVIYNWSLQLTAQQLADARALWASAGPLDYDLDYRVKRNGDPQPDAYHVEVRRGRAVRVVCNGHLLLVDDAPTGLLMGSMAGLFRADDPARQTIEGIFEHLNSLATATREKSAPKRDYCTAKFDKVTGHPIHMVHRVAGTHQRQEWVIRVKPVTGP